MQKNKSLAFTMAEILLSLTIIGVVAAITLPSLMANINERTWNTQRKALYARMSQAIGLMPHLNGYGEYEGTNTDGSVTVIKDTATETFLTEGLSKVLKINNICDAAHLADCGVAGSYTNMAGSVLSMPTKLSELNSMFIGIYSGATNNGTLSGIVLKNPQRDINTKAAAFETLSGETIITFYNPLCSVELGKNFDSPAEYYDHGYTQQLMCANFIYDLNGNKGPNTVGKDIGFITAMYPFSSTVVAPMPLPKTSGTVAYTDALGLCVSNDVESRLPNADELSAMFYNMNLIGATSTERYWSSSKLSSDYVWFQRFDSGQRHSATQTVSLEVRCVKR